MNVVDKTGSTGFYIEGEASSEHMSFNYWVSPYLFLVLVQHELSPNYMVEVRHHKILDKIHTQRPLKEYQWSFQFFFVLKNDLK